MARLPDWLQLIDYLFQLSNFCFFLLWSATHNVTILFVCFSVRGVLYQNGWTYQTFQLILLQFDVWYCIM